MWINIPLTEVPRLSRFPYQLKEIGYTHGGIYQERTMYSIDKFEMCLRLYSQEKAAIDYLNGVKYVTEYPHVIIKIPHIAHRYSIDAPREAFSFAYAPACEVSLRDVLPFPDRQIWKIELDDVKSNLIAELTELMQCSRNYAIADRMDLLAFQLLELLILNAGREKEKQDYHEVKIRSIASYFQINFREKINIDTIASNHGMSRSTFTRHWKRFYDCPPGQYLLDLKLQYACRSLLEDTNLKVCELSDRLNFQDPEYFCALFRKKFGMTPLEYRKVNNLAAQLPEIKYD